MAENQIKSVSIKHDAIMDYLLVNPTVPLSTVADHFGIGQAWLSVIIHSDAFQAQLGEKKQGVFLTTVVPLREKLMGVANFAVEKLGIALEQSKTESAEGKKFVADTTDMILQNLGYSPKAGPTASVSQQNNTIVIQQADKGMLEGARAIMRGSREEVLIEHTEDITSDEV